MDIKTYISSGVLELYVLDQLSASERRDVEAMVMKYPELKKEINSIEESLFAVASSTAKTPRAGLQSQIINSVLAADNNSANTSKSNIGNWYLGLAFLGFGLAGVFGWLFNQEKKAVEIQNQEMIIAKDSCDQKDEIIRRQQKMLEDIFFDESQLIPLNGTEVQTNSKANIVYNQVEQSVLLEASSLPPAPTGKQYQLWGIVNGTPVDLGVFDISTDGIDLINMKYSDGVQAFAVTLEPEGGSIAPTLEEMYVIGNVGS